MRRIVKAFAFVLAALPLAVPVSAQVTDSLAVEVTDSLAVEVTDSLAVEESQKCADCIISSVLESLPAADLAELDAQMERLASVSEESVHALVSMLAPPEEGENSVYEYALNGLVAYVSAPGREALAAPVKDALLASVGECEDDANRAFLLTLSRLLVGRSDAAAIARWLGDEYLHPFAVSVLITIPGIEDEVVNLLKGAKEPDAGLAYLAAAKGVSGAEKYLLKWLPSNDATLCRNVYAALGKCGGKKSLDVLAAAAKADDYGLGTTNATESYLCLVARLVDEDNSKGMDEARMLLKSDRTHIRTAALDILLHSGRVDGRALVLEAVEDEDKEYRCAALFEAAGFADEDFCEAVAQLLPELTNDAKTDVVSWLGERHAAGQIAAIVEETGSQYPPLADAAIRAAGKIGGDEALSALTSCLSGPNAHTAEEVLGSFPGSITSAVLTLLDGTTVEQTAALHLASRRRIKESFDMALALTRSPDVRVSQAAYWALAGTCTADDFDRLCTLLDSCPGTYVAAVQAAAVYASTGTDHERILSAFLASPTPERHYPVLAADGDAEAVDILMAAAREGSQEACFSLLKVDSQIISELLELAGLNPRWRDDALSRVCDQIQTYVSPQESAAYYNSALELRPSPRTANKLLTALGDSGSPDGIGIAVGYTDDQKTCAAAAYAIKGIASANPELLSDDACRAALSRAREVFSALAAADPDAGYAVDEINLLLAD